MKITPIEHGLNLSASDLVRSPGLHMSDIYEDLYHKLEPKRYTLVSDSGLALMGAMGTAWETHLRYLLHKAGMASVRPDEFRTAEGIAFSPDLLIDNGMLRLGEIKLKWMSSRDMPRGASASRFPPKLDKTMTQMLSYCHALETPHARLYSLFVNGNWNKPYVPELLTWDVEFTARELKDEWRMMLNHARDRGLL